MSFSKRLKRARAEKRISQEQLAERLSVSRQTVSKWETEKSYPEVEKLIELAGLLEVSIDYLLLGIETAFVWEENRETVTKEVILNEVSRTFRVSIDKIRGKDRSLELRKVRGLIIYLCRELTELSLREIGDLLGKRELSAVLHHLNAVQQDEPLRKKAEELKKQILNQH